MPEPQKPREILPEDHPEVQEEKLAFARHREAQRRPIRYPPKEPAQPPQPDLTRH
jgi:hypothetical protein